MSDTMFRQSTGTSESRHVPIVVLAVIAGVCLVLLIVGAVLVGKNSKDVAARDTAVAASRGRGIALLVIGCVGVCVFGVATGIVSFKYAKLQKELARGYTPYAANMSFGGMQIKGLGGQIRAMGSNVFNTAAAAVNKKLAPPLPRK